MEDILNFLQGSGPDILFAVLAILGGLKVVARYTPFKWDDELLAVVEKPLNLIASILLRRK